MIHPRIDQLLNQVDSRYALVIVAAKRARQINNYHHQLGEGTFDEFAPPLIESRSKNYLTMSLEEISEGKITYDYKREPLRGGHNLRHEPDPSRRQRRDRLLQGM
jgi:DNA-directed RNA polymerase subunit omega